MEEENRVKIEHKDQYWPCIFDDYVFYYSNGKAFKCDHDGYILEQRDQDIIKLPNEPYHGGQLYSNDLPEYFDTCRIEVNGELKFFTNILSDLVEFDHFDIRIVMPIADF